MDFVQQANNDEPLACVGQGVEEQARRAELLAAHLRLSRLSKSSTSLPP
jgi:hypothetical protein